jgi:hypothetical protein
VGKWFSSIAQLVRAAGVLTVAALVAGALLAAGAGASPPSLTGSWQDKSAPAPRSTWHLDASNGLQTLTGSWQGTLTHSGLHGAFQATLNGSGTAYSGTFHVTEASVVVDGTITITIVSPGKISLRLHSNNGTTSSFSLERGVPTIHFSFTGYANDVKVVPPLVGPFQLGHSRFSGSGTLSGASISSTMYDSFVPRFSRYPLAHMYAEVISYSYYPAQHDKYSTLGMTVRITETNAKNCASGDRGTLKLLHTTARLKNGALGDAIGLHWLRGRCSTFEQGWINADGGAKTSPSFGGPPHGGQWAIVKITS